MFNKSILVLALLITLSMATKPEFLSENGNCKHGTLQEALDKSAQIIEGYRPESMEEAEDLEKKFSFLQKLAQILVSYPDTKDNMNILEEFEGDISKNVLDHAKNDRFFYARNALIEELVREDLKTVSMHVFAFSYIKSVLQKKSLSPSACLKTKRLYALYDIKN